MQAIVETLFDAAYLIAVITIGILMIRGSKGERQFRWCWERATHSTWFPELSLFAPLAWKTTPFPWGLGSGSLRSP